ncbi:MAG: serine hydrolase [Dermatophilus congolensis]|nr:serine hydrolase [Dermatophilus congolensis]
MNTEQFTTSLDRHLDSVTNRRREHGKPQVAVRATDLGLDYRYGDRPEPFHVASIGKLFTGTLIGMEMDTGRLAPDTLVSSLLPHDELRGLFRATPADVAGGATVEHLLSHTAGLADYYSGRTVTGLNAEKLLVAEPDRLWTPADLLAITRERQRPLAAPGEKFAYCDTGYILLGRIVEELSGAAFHEQVHARIFDPLCMTSSFMPYRSLPRRAESEAGDALAPPTLAPAYYGTTDISGNRSMTVDWAGGGVASTLDDLLAFSESLHGGRLVSAGTLEFMARPRNTFRAGLKYGASLFTVEIDKFAPWMRGYPKPVGGIGILSTFLFHDPVHGADIALNFGGTGSMARGTRTLIQIEVLFRKALRGR